MGDPNKDSKMCVRDGCGHGFDMHLDNTVLRIKYGKCNVPGCKCEAIEFEGMKSLEQLADFSQLIGQVFKAGLIRSLSIPELEPTQIVEMACNKYIRDLDFLAQTSSTISIDDAKAILEYIKSVNEQARTQELSQGCA